MRQRASRRRVAMCVCDAQAMSMRDGRAMTDVCDAALCTLPYYKANFHGSYRFTRAAAARSSRRRRRRFEACVGARGMLYVSARCEPAWGLRLALALGKGVEGGWGEMDHVCRRPPLCMPIDITARRAACVHAATPTYITL